MSDYRTLEAGEIIQAGDEYDNCANPWKDWPKWVPVNKMIGEIAPDPRYPAHRQYRRLIPTTTGPVAKVAPEPGKSI